MASAAIAACSAQLPVAHRSTPAVGDDAMPLPACAAAPSKAVGAELRHELNVGPQRDVWPIALSPDGRVLYVETTTQGFHGIAEESTRTGTILRRVAKLPPQLIHAQGALGPDGDIVWVNTYKGGGQGEGRTSAAQMWSPRTGLRALEPAGQSSEVLSVPVVSGTDDQHAAWEQADGARQEIIEADLVTGVADVIARGYVGPPVFVGSALVWPVAPNAATAYVPGRDPQSPSRLVAVNAGTFPARGHVPLPPALRAANSQSQIASNGTEVAYSDQTELFYSPSPAESARLLVRLHGFDTFTPGGLSFGAGYLSWETSPSGSYLATTTSFAVLTIPGFTLIGADGSGAVIVNYIGPKLKQVSHLHVLTESSINALKCAEVG
jgi:hypothetical protein